jgi:hypothetical protein
MSKESEALSAVFEQIATKLQGNCPLNQRADRTVPEANAT